MGSTQERIKKRREYLKKKGVAYTMMGLALLVAEACVLIVLVFVLRIVFGGVLPNLVTLALLSLVFSGVLFLLAFSAGRQVEKRLKQLPYVPPVTTDTLPAEEVLVRGSAQPAQEQSKVLLRGTQSRPEAAEALLRSSQGQDRD